MEIETRAFGPLEIDEQQVITLTEPMPGFAGHRRFVVLNPEPEASFSWFQSIERKDLCFLITDPRQFFPDYVVEIEMSALADLQVSDERHMAVAVVLTVPEDPAHATANLLAPIVFNTQKKLARQVILEGSGNPVREPLFREEKRVCQGL